METASSPVPSRGRWLAALLTLVFDVAVDLSPVVLRRYHCARLAERFHLTTV